MLLATQDSARVDCVVHVLKEEDRQRQDCPKDDKKNAAVKAICHHVHVLDKNSCAAASNQSPKDVSQETKETSAKQPEIYSLCDDQNAVCDLCKGSSTMKKSLGNLLVFNSPDEDRKCMVVHEHCAHWGIMEHCVLNHASIQVWGHTRKLDRNTIRHNFMFSLFCRIFPSTAWKMYCTNLDTGPA